MLAVRIAQQHGGLPTAARASRPKIARADTFESTKLRNLSKHVGSLADILTCMIHPCSSSLAPLYRLYFIGTGAFAGGLSGLPHTHPAERQNERGVGAPEGIGDSASPLRIGNFYRCPRDTDREG